ncbi:large ribosomal subunit protein eL20-like [Macaca mulatta]
MGSEGRRKSPWHTEKPPLSGSFPSSRTQKDVVAAVVWNSANLTCQWVQNTFRPGVLLATLHFLTAASCYQDVGTQHHIWAHLIQIMKVEETRASKRNRPAVTQLHDSKVESCCPTGSSMASNKPRVTTKRPDILQVQGPLTLGLPK